MDLLESLDLQMDFFLHLNDDFAAARFGDLDLLFGAEQRIDVQVAIDPPYLPNPDGT